MEFIRADGTGSSFSSDRGFIDVHFTTPEPGQVNIRANSDIMLPDAAGGGLGENIIVDVTVDGAAGTFTGTINGKGIGKGR